MENENFEENYSQILDGNWTQISEAKFIEIKLAEQL